MRARFFDQLFGYGTKISIRNAEMQSSLVATLNPHLREWRT
jgi:hypothetical protein